MENISSNISNIKEQQILSTIKDIKENLTQEKIDTQKLNLECSCVNMFFISKDKSIGKTDILSISNKSQFNPSEINFYKSLKSIQGKIKTYPYESFVKKICLYPKQGINNKFCPLTGISIGFPEAKLKEGNEKEKEKEEKLINSSGISVISLIEAEDKTSFSAKLPSLTHRKKSSLPNQ